MNMTDGYNIEVFIDLVIAGDYKTTSTNGMCFGHEPATNGGYCLTWVGTGDNSGDAALQTQIAQSGFNVQFIPAASWSSTNWPGARVGTILDPNNSGVSYTPDTTGRATCPVSANCAGCLALGTDCWPILDTDADGVGDDSEDEEGMAVGATLFASWYMPKEYSEYNDLYRIS
jgi:hypothetical protein